MCKKYFKRLNLNLLHNRVNEDFSLQLHTPPSMRVRSGRFTDLNPPIWISNQRVVVWYL